MVRASLSDIPKAAIEHFPELLSESAALRATVPQEYRGEATGAPVGTDFANSLAYKQDFAEILAINCAGNALMRSTTLHAYAAFRPHGMIDGISGQTEKTTHHRRE
ncbi:MAG: hypothetical protein CBARDCOR_3626, partial [uncultured Caballeronia sp.]